MTATATKLRTFLLAGAALLSVFLVGAVPGCLSREDAAAFREEARAAVTAAEESVALLEAEAAKLPEGSPERVALENRAEDIRKDTLAPAWAALERLEDAITPEGEVDFAKLTGVAAPFLPPPLGVLLAAAGPLLAWGVDAARRTNAAKSLVKSIQKLRDAFPDVEAKFDPATNDGRAAVALLNSTQTPLAKSIVDKVQKDAAKKAA